ncbi:Nn.00g006590.m01.CDS01 [Neocucurbitaria sp. VM-36]
MSPLLVLPAPLPSTSITLGQLVTDPLYAESASLKPSTTPAHKESHVQSKYEDTVAHDDYGRFTSTRFISKLCGQPHYSHENLLLLNAEQMSHTTIDKPALVFNNLRRDSTTRSFLRKMAYQNNPVYFVTGVQTLKNPSFKRAVVEHGLIAEAKTPQFRLPVRRVDSASSLDNSNSATETDESILAVELLKVKCRVGPSSEPHSVADLDYSWSYHTLEGDDEDLQLSIGLGKALQATELRALAGISNEEEGYSEEGSWSSSYSDSEDGIGGF